MSDPIVSDRLVPLGWDARHAAAFDDVAAPAHRHGTNSDSVPARVTRVTRVTRVDRGACDLVGAEGASRAYIAPALLQRAAADPVAAVCVGDWVAVRPGPNGAPLVDAVLPRRTGGRARCGHTGRVIRPGARRQR
ncbi:MAG: hypothetical protein M3Q27_05025 [Actinomycetota bacterium]|nr:hypothetical protein [Actinomycetota bacterium]